MALGLARAGTSPGGGSSGPGNCRFDLSTLRIQSARPASPKRRAPGRHAAIAQRGGFKEFQCHPTHESAAGRRGIAGPHAMNRLWQTPWWLGLCIVGQGNLSPTLAGTVPAVPPPAGLLSTSTNGLSALPRPRSPVDLFRQLLAMTPEEREAFLTNRPPQTRDRILAKIDEYQALDPNERELRLRATELRWSLWPLMQESPDQRPARLAQGPPHLREL